MIICLDPGHGGEDPGAVYKNFFEKDAALSIAKKVRDVLSDYFGFRIVMTREEDQTVPLAVRCNLANKINADIFISIHLNASNRPDATGIETWRLVKSSENAKTLADNIQTRLIYATGAINRGVKLSPGFYVLKHTQMPAVLIETGFITNPHECNLLFCDAYQKGIAVAIAEGVKNYCGIVQKDRAPG